MLLLCAVAIILIIRKIETEGSRPQFGATGLVIGKLQAHLQDSRQPYQFECRMMTKSGGWKWIANHGKIVRRDSAGNPL